MLKRGVEFRGQNLWTPEPGSAPSRSAIDNLWVTMEPFVFLAYFQYHKHFCCAILSISSHKLQSVKARWDTRWLRGSQASNSPKYLETGEEPNNKATGAVAEVAKMPTIYAKHFQQRSCSFLIKGLSVRLVSDVW